MKIVIVGDGDTGVHLARQLSAEQQDVVLLGSNKKTLSRLDATQNFLTCEGSPTLPSDLIQAGTRDCDLFIAVTPWGNDNIIAAQIAHAMNAHKTVARVDCYEFISEQMQAFFAGKGVHTLVYPELLATTEIANALNYPGFRGRYAMHNGELIVAAIKIKKDSMLDGIYLRDFNKEKYHFHVSTLKRGNDVIIPSGSDRILNGDIAYVTYPLEEEMLLNECIGHTNQPLQKIIIVGADKMSFLLAKTLGQTKKLTIIDTDSKKCNFIADNCRNVTVVNADYKDIDVLRDEGIGEADAFIALTDSSETNIVSCMVARDAGVKKTIAEIEDLQYFTEAEHLNIDTVVNKKLLTSSTIFQMLLDNMLQTPKCWAFEDAEVAEIVVQIDSPVTKAKIKDLKLSKKMTIAGIIRNGKAILASGDTQILPEDHVVVFCVSGLLPRIKKYFK